jgi:hypothetical protein
MSNLIGLGRNTLAPALMNASWAFTADTPTIFTSVSPKARIFSTACRITQEIYFQATNLAIVFIYPT